MNNNKILKKTIINYFKQCNTRYDKKVLNNVFYHLNNCINLDKFNKKELEFFEVIISLCFEEHQKYIKKVKTK